MRSTIVIVAFLFAGFFCGGTLSAQRRTVPNPYGKTACQILTQAQVESVTGPFVSKMDPYDIGNDSINCQYEPATSLKIEVYLHMPTPPPVSDPHQVLANSDSTKSCEQVSGVGDGGVLCLGGGLDTLSKLTIFKGGKLLFELTIQREKNLSLIRTELSKLAAMTLQGMGYHETPGSAELVTVDPTVMQPLLKPSTPGDSRADQLKHALLPLAEGGNARAQAALAALYRDDASGKDASIQPNYAAAAYWYQEAAKQNLPEAQFELGTLYRDGLGVQKDVVTGNEFFLKAAQGGDASAMAALGEFHLRHAEKTLRWDQAQMWLQKAVAAGDVYANTDLGLLYYETTKNRAGMIGMPESPETSAKGYGAAMNAYRLAADAGDCAAKLNIGKLYFNGDGVPQDGAMAQAWFAKAKSCSGDASSELSKKAAQFQQRAANGELPLVEPLPSGPTVTGQAPPQLSLVQVIFLGLAVLTATEVIEDSKRTPEERARAAKNIQENHMNNELFRQQHRSACMMNYATFSNPNPAPCDVWR